MQAKSEGLSRKFLLVALSFPSLNRSLIFDIIVEVNYMSTVCLQYTKGL
jgi:hypothetical protein